MGKDVFLDLKLFEIPNSVAGAVRAAGALGASMVTSTAWVAPASWPPPWLRPATTRAFECSP